jgi:hypothetical protein
VEEEEEEAKEDEKKPSKKAATSTQSPERVAFVGLLVPALTAPQARDGRDKTAGSNTRNSMSGSSNNNVPDGAW